MSRVFNEDVFAELCEHIHEAADVAINPNGYADDSEESDKRSKKRDKLEAALMAVVEAAAI